MELKFNCTGNERKRLAKAISEITYLYAPSFAYQVGGFLIDRNGTIAVDGCGDTVDLNALLQQLETLGFTAELNEIAEHSTAEPEPTPAEGICISMPASLFSDTALQNLKNLVTAKRALICKALGVENLPIEVTEATVSFPWFVGQPTPEEVNAYDHFICALCEMALNQKRINAKERDTGNDKYAFRCFLLRLGFIGPEYKQERKILLQNLSGSSAFKAPQRKEVADDAISQ